MKILYVGQLEQGSTSSMRFNIIKSVLMGCKADFIDISVPIKATNKMLRSIGWRYNKGPLIKNINDYILANLVETDYNLVWVDKAQFIKPSTALELKKAASTFIHFTPDPAFLYNKSSLLDKHIQLYDLCVTTKSYEVHEYYKAGVKDLLLTTQGFDPSVHKFKSTIDKSGVCFIGHYEDHRGRIIQNLIDKEILVKLAGTNWRSFVSKNKQNANLVYYGEGVYNEAYSDLISGSFIGLGFLSKWFPELHTTRTFEIPACGTALLTEANDETTSFYSDEEAIFFKNEEDITGLVVYYLNNVQELTSITTKGMNRVLSAGYDYRSIIENILRRASIYE